MEFWQKKDKKENVFEQQLSRIPDHPGQKIAGNARDSKHSAATSVTEKTNKCYLSCDFVTQKVIIIRARHENHISIAKIIAIKCII